MDLSQYANCEVFGVSMQAYIQGFRQYPSVLEKYFTRYGLKREGQALSDISMEAWYSMEKWLLVTHAIVDEVGASTAYTVGKKVSDTAMIPPEVDSAAKVLPALDVVYHLHHRKDGIVMFDPSTGVMLEGIGHYACKLESESSASFVCDVPYPCDLDRGILTGFTGRFEPAVSVTHGTGGCRKKGDPSCTYLVQW